MRRLLSPGKVDAHFRHVESSEEYNAFWWSPVFKGGVGALTFKDRQHTDYVGGFVRPLAAWPDQGDLILGFHHVGSATAEDYELQGEYRLPVGLGVGGGLVDRSAGGADVRFGKVSYRTSGKGWRYVVEAQGQDVAETLSPGGYAAVFNDQLMLVYGNDAEQWRSAIGYIAPDTSARIRPAADVLYVDNAIGRLDGAQTVLANASLKYEGGFLSHPARLGRAMGPTGLEFGNPLGFLTPTWNRRLDVWELGGLANARLDWTKSSAGAITWRADLQAFPLQFDRATTFLDGYFLGGYYAATGGEESPGVVSGFVLRRIGIFELSAAWDYGLKTSDTRIDAALIARF